LRANYLQPLPYALHPIPLLIPIQLPSTRGMNYRCSWGERKPRRTRAGALRGVGVGRGTEVFMLAMRHPLFPFSFRCEVIPVPARGIAIRVQREIASPQVCRIAVLVRNVLTSGRIEQNSCNLHRSTRSIGSGSENIACLGVTIPSHRQAKFLKKNQISSIDD